MITKDRLNFEFMLDYCITNAPSATLKNKMLGIQSSYNNHNQAMIVGIAQQVFKAYEGIKVYVKSKNIDPK